jgi:tetratricopeptide (TPR) repeat protein
LTTPPVPDAYQTALTMAAMGLHKAAFETLLEVTAKTPSHAAAWSKLAELHRLAGQDKAANAALARATGDLSKWPPPLDPRTPEQFAAGEALVNDTIGPGTQAERMVGLRSLLTERPRASGAMRLLAQLEREDGDDLTARTLLERALELAPQYAGCRADLAQLLMDQHCYARALAEAERLLADAPGNTMYRAMRADALRAVGRLAEAIVLMEALIQAGQNSPGFQCVYAQALHFAGRSNDAARIYRACLTAQDAASSASAATAYWGLAELRGEFLTGQDVVAMRALLACQDLTPSDRMMALYALGHALERAGDFEASFSAYDDAARTYREAVSAVGLARKLAAASQALRRQRNVFTAENLAGRLPQPVIVSGAPTPIFIVGMPRAGSTLVEHILASHSLVEATLELPIIEEITRDLKHSRAIVQTDAYPGCLRNLTSAQLAALGARYIEQAAAYRSTAKPYFVDKRPANWRDIGLIHLILPHAKIIDVRREPMAACFAMFKQVLPDASFSYDLAELGRAFNEYVAMMRHWNEVLPGRVHSLQYERLVDDSEGEIRRLLAYCGLPFEPSCLRFWETERAVATPSAGQVRRPIFRDAVEQWHNYEPWLGPLAAALNEQG